MTDPTQSHATPVGSTVDDDHTYLRDRLRHVSWGAIFAGLSIAIALQILLGFLGIGLGFSMLDPTDPMGGFRSWGIGTGIYFVLTQVLSLFAGGYIAVRLAPARRDRPQSSTGSRSGPWRPSSGLGSAGPRSARRWAVCPAPSLPSAAVRHRLSGRSSPTISRCRI